MSRDFTLQRAPRRAPGRAPRQGPRRTLRGVGSLLSNQRFCRRRRRTSGPSQPECLRHWESGPAMKTGKELRTGSNATRVNGHQYSQIHRFHILSGTTKTSSTSLQGDHADVMPLLVLKNNRMRTQAMWSLKAICNSYI